MQWVQGASGKTCLGCFMRLQCNLLQNMDHGYHITEPQSALPDSKLLYVRMQCCECTCYTKNFFKMYYLKICD